MLLHARAAEPSCILRRLSHAGSSPALDEIGYKLAELQTCRCGYNMSDFLVYASHRKLVSNWLTRKPRQPRYPQPPLESQVPGFHAASNSGAAGGLQHPQQLGQYCPRARIGTCSTTGITPHTSHLWPVPRLRIQFRGLGSSPEETSDGSGARGRESSAATWINAKRLSWWYSCHPHNRLPLRASPTPASAWWQSCRPRSAAPFPPGPQGHSLGNAPRRVAPAPIGCCSQLGCQSFASSRVGYRPCRREWTHFRRP